MTGNDILSRQLHPPPKRLQRHAGRMLTSSEMRYFNNSKEQSLDCLKYWACKEAAYKIYVKKGGERKLNPKQFVVEWEGNYAYVSNLYHEECYTGNVALNEHFIHATLWENEAQVKSKVISLSQTEGDRPSREVRDSLCHALGTHFSQLTKNDRNIPSLPAWDISMSHSGKWGAWSALKL